MLLRIAFFIEYVVAVSEGCSCDSLYLAPPPPSQAPGGQVAHTEHATQAVQATGSEHAWQKDNHEHHRLQGSCALPEGRMASDKTGRRSFIPQSLFQLTCLRFQRGPGNCEGTDFLMRLPVGAASSRTGNITRIAFLVVFYYFCFCSWTELGSTRVHGNEI